MFMKYEFEKINKWQIYILFALINGPHPQTNPKLFLYYWQILQLIFLEISKDF